MISRVPESTLTEMESAVGAAKAAFPAWSEQSILSRQQVMFNLQHLVKKHMVRTVAVEMCFLRKNQCPAESETCTQSICMGFEPSQLV